MGDKEEKTTPVRRTRSGKVVAAPPSKSPAAKTPAKPTTRRTRKKVVLMEVEVSDDDEDVPEEKSESKDGSDQEAEVDNKKSEDKVLEISEESSETSGPKGKSKPKEDTEDEEKHNGNLANIKDGKQADDEILVLNDIEMFGSEDVNDSNDQSREPEQEEDLKMDVDEEENFASLDKSNIETAGKLESTEETRSEDIAKVTESEKTADVPEGEETSGSPKKDSTSMEAMETIDLSESDDAETGKLEENIVQSSDAVKADQEQDVESKDKVKKQSTKVSEVTVDVSEETEKPVKGDDAKEANKVVKEDKAEEADKVVEEDKAEKADKVVEEDEAKEDDKVVITDDEAKEADKVAIEKDSKKADKVEKEESKEADKVVKDAGVKKSEVVIEDETKEADTVVEKKSDSKDEDAKESKEDEKESKEDEKASKEDEKESKEDKKESKEDEKESKEDGKEEKSCEKSDEKKTEDSKQNGDPDAENISEDELPGVPVAKVPEAEEVSDEELPGPKRAELPADTEVVSEDELPTVKKEGVKRKLSEGDYDPGSPTSENEAPAKKPSLEAPADKEKEEKKPKKLPELDKYWKAVNDDPTDFTGWTYLLQYVDQENDMEAAREAYDAFLSHYPYCYGYWRKYADYEKRKGNKKKCEEVFERGLKAIPLSVDLWIHYLTYVKTSRPDDEEFIRSQFERALLACGLEFRSDRLWDSYIKWETEAKRLQKVTAIYDRLLATPTQGYTSHFDNFQEHVASNAPNKIVEVDEFFALRKEVRHMLKHDVTTEATADNSDAPPGDDDQTKVISSDEETKSIRERIVSIRRKVHKATVNAVTSRWNYEEGIKRPYFHVKPLERCQLKNWQDYLDYETEQGDRVRIIVLFERCLIACALYEEFWMKFVHYLEELKDPEVQQKIRDVYERACTIHHLKKPSLHLQWAMFEESVDNCNRAAEILVNLEKSVPNVLQIAYRRINLERRRMDHEKCSQLYEHYINNSKNKIISSNIAIKYSRFCLKVLKDFDKAQEVLKTAIGKDPNNPRLYLQLIDMTLQKEGLTESDVIEVIDLFLDKETTDAEQKVLFAQRKLEYLEDFGTDIQSVQTAYDQYQKYIKQSKDNAKKKEIKSEVLAASKKEKSLAPSSSQSSNYGNYGNYSNSSAQPSYPPYSGSQQGQYNYSQYGQGDQQYQYQNWQYPQGGYTGGYNQWGNYGGGYGY